MTDNIFGGLEKFGLETLIDKAADIFDSAAKRKQPEAETKKEKVFDIDDYIYPKRFDCPVCLKNFITFVPKWSKMRLQGTDYDLRAIYEPINPMFYDVIVCEFCGYSAVSESFSKITERQSEFILSEISPNFKPYVYPKEPDIDMVIDRYKLALLSSTIKRAKFGEKAYVCMKLAWLYRIKGDELENEKMFAQLASRGFANALADERTPIMGLEEGTILYLIAAFSKFLGQNKNAMKILSTIIVSKKASERLKNRARDLKNEIIAESTKKNIAPPHNKLLTF